MIVSVRIDLIVGESERAQLFFALHAKGYYRSQFEEAGRTTSQRAAEYPQPTITRFCRNRRERCGQCDDRRGVLDDQTLPPDLAEDSAIAREDARRVS
jgi:hypothetical protein